ncbi:pilus assembly protein TadB [Kribbella sandramycini]|uniref:Pilus assembly protein TadB n=1 Tax=Kribbella sandramycini TaxID=60450 RepID=A0A7Y4KWR4_9ACTN|nr:type II secretion system F family protein [Kribbella sandramycini]MBB6567300.1 tight adherence protein C [Kribbella sandramycini]NOL40088.1 pilus assembly protein TadB [Kribbella sandramycini]
MSPILLGGVLGGLFGLGLLVVVRRLPFLRKPTADDRISPYLRDLGGSEVFAGVVDSGSPFYAIVRLFGPSLRSGARRLERLLGGASSIRRRLARAGLERTVEEFRIEQLLWGTALFGAGLVVSLIAVSLGAGNPVGMLFFCALLGVLGVLARDTYLSTQVRNRERRLLAELPTVAELLALSVAAGEGPAAALDRVARSCRGELADELKRVLAETRAGETLVRALDGLADRTGLLALSRFADGLAVALERGTPLADVLRAQAGDIREAGRRELIESGARREVAMMVPVIFLVLPVTIAFAFYPGAVGIRLIAG